MFCLLQYVQHSSLERHFESINSVSISFTRILLRTTKFGRQAIWSTQCLCFCDNSVFPYPVWVNHCVSSSDYLSIRSIDTTGIDASLLLLRPTKQPTSVRLTLIWIWDILQMYMSNLEHVHHHFQSCRPCVLILIGGMNFSHFFSIAWWQSLPPTSINLLSSMAYQQLF